MGHWDHQDITPGMRGDHPRNGEASPQGSGSIVPGKIITPGMGEHCPRGEFMPPGIRNHYPGEINPPRKGNVSPAGIGGGGMDPSPQGSAEHRLRGLHHRRDPLPSSLLLTDGSRRTFPADLPPGSASGIRTAPGWQQLSPSWGTGAAVGSRPGSWASPPKPGQS